MLFHYDGYVQSHVIYSVLVLPAFLARFGVLGIVSAPALVLLVPGLGSGSRPRPLARGPLWLGRAAVLALASFAFGVAALLRFVGLSMWPLVNSKENKLPFKLALPARFVQTTIPLHILFHPGIQDVGLIIAL